MQISIEFYKCKKEEGHIFKKEEGHILKLKYSFFLIYLVAQKGGGKASFDFYQIKQQTQQSTYTRFHR